METKQTKIKGLWWLPEKPKEKWVGSLVTGKSRSLRLKFTVPEGYCKRLPDSPEAIHGVNSNSKAISLLFPGRSSSTLSSAFTGFEYSAGYAILGFHLKNAGALKLNKATFSLQYLHDWMGRTGFLNNRETSRRFSITYERPQVLPFKLDTNLRLEVHTWAHTQQGRRIYEVEESTDWRLCFPEPAGLKEILDLLSSLRGLLHFTPVSQGRKTDQRLIDGQEVAEPK
jgi:hypothetical protein